jgi:hypothetical protein
MRHFKKIITIAFSIICYLLIYSYASGTTRSTVQVTLAPNQMADSQVNKLFDQVDNEHLKPYINNPTFEIGTNDDS